MMAGAFYDRFYVPASGGGGGVNPTQWDPDYDTSTNPKSDDYPGNSLNGKWEQWDPGSVQTVSVQDGYVRLLSSTGATYSAAGIIQPAPSDNYFSVTARVRFFGLGFDQYNFFGIVFGNDLSSATGAPTTAPFHVAGGAAYNQISYLHLSQWNNYQSWQQNLELEQMYGYDRVVRVFFDRTTNKYQLLVSGNGEPYTFAAVQERIWTSFGITSLDSIGLGVWGNTSAEIGMTCRYFAVETHTDASTASMQIGHGGIPS